MISMVYIYIFSVEMSHQFFCFEIQLPESTGIPCILCQTQSQSLYLLTGCQQQQFHHNPNDNLNNLFFYFTYYFIICYFTNGEIIKVKKCSSDPTTSWEYQRRKSTDSRQVYESDPDLYVWNSQNNIG